MNKSCGKFLCLDNPDLGKLFLRLAIGIVFVYAGWMKIGDLDKVAGFFGAIGLYPWMAYLVAYAEFLGGIALILGLLVRYVGLILSVVMLVATLKVHVPNGYSLQNGGYEYVLVLLLGCLAIITLGAGRYALEAYCCKRCQVADKS